MRRLLAILWSAAIAAAFLGPGTITTASRAGAGFGVQLLWALTFSTVACLVLQEASARLTVVSGKTLGQALRARFRHGPMAMATLVLVLGAVIVGCAAYEAGNILGGVAGARLAIPLSAPVLTVLCVLGAGALLWTGSTGVVVAVRAVLVAAMGSAFVLTAFALGPEVGEILASLLVPRLPAGATVLVLGLVGTTVVPYNLFLGSGLARGQSLGDMRFGLVVAIGLGGLISMAVLVVGTVISGPFSFEALATMLGDRFGAGSVRGFALGLFAAGFSSAITAPLAAAMTVRSMFESSTEPGRWNERSWRYRAVWAGVLATGLVFGLSGIRPVPAIIGAQALNGVMLPVVAAFLLLAVNDRGLLGQRVNGLWGNALSTVVVGVAALLGSMGVMRAIAAVLGTAAEPRILVRAGLAGACAVMAAVVLGIVRMRRRPVV
jgi:Mn2+/Fe2+ NRAMP family transporter